MEPLQGHQAGNADPLMRPAARKRIDQEDAGKAAVEPLRGHKGQRVPASCLQLFLQGVCVLLQRMVAAAGHGTMTYGPTREPRQGSCTSCCCSKPAGHLLPLELCRVPSPADRACGSCGRPLQPLTAAGSSDS